MRADDIGTSDESVIYFNAPSAAAKEVFLYPTYLGHYYCDSRYNVDRSNFDSFLFMYVKCGEGYVETGSIKRRLGTGSVVLLDCYRPHRYYTLTNWEIIWVHFDGPTARKYFAYATQKQQILAPFNPNKMVSALNKMLDIFTTQASKNEALLGKYLTDLLTEFIMCASEGEGPKSENIQIEESMKYISEHLHEDITLEQLAEQAMLSPFYFSRLFKKKTGFTPYRYLITVRLDYSCYLLRTSNYTIKEIAYRCGFHSVSSFCTSFRKTIGITPKQYREN